MTDAAKWIRRPLDSDENRLVNSFVPNWWHTKKTPAILFR